jgi:hypothetical protein
MEIIIIDFKFQNLANKFNITKELCYTQIELNYTLNLFNVMPCYILKPYGTDVLNVNHPPCCHVSFPYIIAFAIKIMHQRVQSTYTHARIMLSSLSLLQCQLYVIP